MSILLVHLGILVYLAPESNFIQIILSRYFDPNNLIQMIWSRYFDPDNLIQIQIYSKYLKYSKNFKYSQSRWNNFTLSLFFVKYRIKLNGWIGYYTVSEGKVFFLIWSWQKEICMLNLIWCYLCIYWVWTFDFYPLNLILIS